MSVDQLLTRLVAMSGGRIGSLVRGVCADTLSLRPLPVEVAVDGPASDAEAVVAEFAEQFSIDVSMIDDEQRARLSSAAGDNVRGDNALGDTVLGVAIQVYLADFLPRVRAGLLALGQSVPWAAEPVAWDHDSDPSGLLFNEFAPAVARLRGLDAVTSELIRLRGAAQHNCRLCKSLREGTALDRGGSEALYTDIEQFETSELLTEAQKAALRYADALIWSPAHIGSDVAAGVRRHFSDAQAVELTLDVLRNAMNKIAVALGADAPRVEYGTERYLIDADGQTVYN